jgi:cycloartenol synthase
MCASSRCCSNPSLFYISDCTGEGLKGVLCLRKSKAVADGIEKGTLEPIGERRLQNAVEVLLSYQNEDGGFATYENNRGFGWYESLNPSEVFGDIMIDYVSFLCSGRDMQVVSLLLSDP